MTGIEQRVLRAYGGERFELPSAALTGLVRRRRRRRGYAVVTTALVAAAAVGIGLDRLQALPEPPVKGEFGVTAAAATCYRQAAGGGEPVAAFTFTDAADPGRRLVVAAADQRAVACTPGGVLSLRYGDREPGEDWLAGGELDFAYGGSDALGLAVIGTTPPGTERVRVELADGTAVPAVVRGGWFATWQPPAADGAAPSLGVRVIAQTGAGDDIEEIETVTE